MFWLCLQLSNYWAMAFFILSDVGGKNIVPSPLCALFVVVSPQLHFSSSQTRALAFMTLLARQVI